MQKFTKIEPVEQGDCSCSPSLSLATDQSMLREITDRTTIIDWEQFYEKLIYKRSNRRLKRGLGKLQALCNDLLTRSDSPLLNHVMDAGDSGDTGDHDGLAQSENLMDTGDSEGTDPELEEVLLEDHYVSAEISGDFIKIYILCRCGTQQQLIVTGNECFLMISPNEDVSGEHHKLVWASKDQNVLLVGIDCSRGTGFLLKKSGPSL